MKLNSNKLLAATVAVGLVGVSGAFAQTADQPVQGDAPAATQDGMQGMADGQGGDMQGMMDGQGDMQGMMSMMNMMAQMSEMMGACTQMMQNMTPAQGAPEHPADQGDPG